MTEPVPRAPYDDSAITADGLEAGLRRTLLVLLRLLRGGRQSVGGRAQPLVDELFRSLSALLEAFGELHLRVGVDGLFLAKEKVLEYSPREDAALFRLFQHGVRQLSFHPGLAQEEIVSLLDALTADLTSLENVEEDVTTLLATKDFASIHFVVVETFSESGGPAGDQDKRAGDLATIMAAAVRQTLSSSPELAGGAKGGTIRFGTADVKFLEGANLPQLIAALPKGGASGVASATDDLELLGLRDELARATSGWLPWLVRSVVTLLLAADEAEAESLAALLARELAAGAIERGLGSVSREVGRLASWLMRVKGSPRSEALRRAVFSPRMRSVAVGALKTADPDAARAAVDVLRSLPDDQVAPALAEVHAAPAGAARDAAVAALMARGAAAHAAAAEIILAGADRDASRSLLRAAAHAPGGRDALALHRAGLGHGDPAVRAAALAWFARYGGDHAVGALASGLRDDAPEVRSAALFLVAASRGSFGRAVVRTWFDGPDFEKLGMDEKRVGALVLARLGGEAVVPAMRELMNKGNLTLRQRVDEMRASAVAALGFVGDEASYEEIARLAKARLAGEALAREAAHVASAVERGLAPYADPLEELRAAALAIGLEDPDARATARPLGVPAVPDVAPAQRVEVARPPGGAGASGHTLSTLAPAWGATVSTAPPTGLRAAPTAISAPPGATGLSAAPTGLTAMQTVPGAPRTGFSDAPPPLRASTAPPGATGLSSAPATGLTAAPTAVGGAPPTGFGTAPPPTPASLPPTSMQRPGRVVLTPHGMPAVDPRERTQMEARPVAGHGHPPAEAGPDADLVRELLGSYSFDDIPPMPPEGGGARGGGGGRGDDGGGES